MVGSRNIRRVARRLLPLVAALACSGVASASSAALLPAGCSATAAYAYGATYGSNCMCSSCTIFCNTPYGPYKNGTCC